MILYLGLYDISVVLYKDRTRFPLYITVLKIIHISITGLTSYLAYQIRDCMVISENLSYYLLLQSKIAKVKFEDSEPPIMYWIPYCADCIGNADPNVRRDNAGEKRCIVCKRFLGPVVNIHHNWFSEHAPNPNISFTMSSITYSHIDRSSMLSDSVINNML